MDFHNAFEWFGRIAMTSIGGFALSPVSIIIWVLVGLIAGWFAARAMKGGGYGLVVDMIVCVIGAVIGGFVFGLIVPGAAGFWGSIVVAVFGAWMLIAVFRFLGFGRSSG
jgi:uncharacterized membrane protein YeaQ/YmgE (transglycosylase-associated protein family)